MKYPLNILIHYIDKGLVVKQDHLTLPLSIYNYSRTCQYERLWDDVTMDCRELVLDSEGNVIAKPFRKFFNMEEHKPEEIPNEPFEVFEKMDNSLGIFFHYGGEWHMATKGSFISDQAVKGMEIAKKYNLHTICVPGFVYLFEIIYPENRIVVNYGTDERLVLLSIINPEGKELDYDEIEMDGWDIVNRYDGIRDYSELKSKISQDNEGFVIKFRNGFRMKIKGDEYVRLHRILTGFSNITIWEYLKDKRDFNEFLDRVPDEFDSWVRTTVEDLKTEYERLENEYRWIFQVLMRSPESETKKGFAELAKRYKHSYFLFGQYDGKKWEHMIWKVLKPKWSKPFRKEI
jgi:hypothetical protein